MQFYLKYFKRLRHYLTGKLLGFKESNIGGKNNTIPVLLEHDESKVNIELNFISTIENKSNYILNNSTYLLKVKGDLRIILIFYIEFLIYKKNY